MNDKTKQLLRTLVNSEHWQAIISVAEETTLDIKKGSTLMDTAEGTFKETALQEGQVMGIKRLIDNIFNTIQ